MAITIPHQLQAHKDFMEKNHIYKLAFSFIKGINNTNAKILLNQIEDLEYIFNHPTISLKHIPNQASNIINKHVLDVALKKANEEIELLNKHKINFHFFTDSNYPYRLRECEDAPLVIYSKGENIYNSPKMLSIVGTRKSSNYGDDTTNKIVEELSKRFSDLTIVSGLAYGIDIAAHKSCIKNNVKTIAVLAHGLNTLYPSSHKSTAQDITNDGGMLITEFPYNDGAEKYNFIKRNRIIAGISDATIIVESAEKGGAIVTARLAHSYNREVLAVPGKISDPYSKGCNKLIKSQVASLIENVDDISQILNWDSEYIEKTVQGQLFYEPNQQEEEVLRQLTIHSDLSMNELCRSLQIPINKLSGLLLQMEFNQLIQIMPGNRYRIK